MLDAIQFLLQSSLPFIRIQLSDIIDIGILAILIYKLLWLLRKSSAGRVLRGILILLLAMWLFSAARLTATSFLLSKVVEWGFLVIVILFQPELRRVLERVGSSKFGFTLSSPKASVFDMEAAITETVEAFTQFSRDKVGALMVFERENLLDDIVKTGTALDCSITSELLKNLFWDKAPMHDGAVIVRGERIIGAGCMLPLSGNVNLSRELGMRHRAGIGISEHCDAVVAIVSEETGSISVALGGMLKRHLTPETLDRLLRNELLSESKEEKKNSTIPLLGFLLDRGKRESEQP